MRPFYFLFNSIPLLLFALLPPPPDTRCSGLCRALRRRLAPNRVMSDLSALSYYLGIEVKQGKEKVTLGQRAYALKLLERAGMTGCKPMATPMEERLKLSKDSTAARVDATRYQSIVGGLWWLTHTRPDIVFAVGYVSRFLEDPREDHWTVVKRLKYLANAGFNCHEDFESGDDTEDDEISPSPLPSEHKAKRIVRMQGGRKFHRRYPDPNQHK